MSEINHYKKIEVGKKYGVVSIAKTPEEIKTGLMWRKKLPSNEGMLFLFETKQTLKFWMKNTFVPLSIAFIDDNMEIFQIEDMEPLSESLIESSRPCQIALEMKKGWLSKDMVGQKIKLKK